MSKLKEPTELSGGIWFTSDNHHHHKGIFKHCPTTREGADVDEMTEIMIKRWNSKIAPNHRVYMLGDFCFHKDKGVTRNILDRLNGKIHVIMGNHDYHFRDYPGMYLDRVEEIVHYKELYIDKIKVVLCHYPMIEWNRMHHGSVMLYGHVHGGLPLSPYRSMDVGIDTRPGMTPYSWEEIWTIMKDREIKSHHGRVAE